MDFKTYHMAQSVEGALENYTPAEFDRAFRGVFTDRETGRPIPTKEARQKLLELHA